MRKISVLWSFTFLLVASTASAALPVIDTSSIAKLVEQIQEMKKQYDVLKKQYDEVISIKNSVQGNYGMGLLENGVDAVMGRRSVPLTWQEVVDLQKSGQLPGLFEGRRDFYKNLLPKIDSKLISSDPKDRNRVSYEMATNNTGAALASVEVIYDGLQKRLKTIEALTQEIDKTQNIKEASDLNSRMVAETGFINMELARLNALQLSLQATLQNNQNQATAINAEFFSKPTQGKTPNSNQK